MVKPFIVGKHNKPIGSDYHFASADIIEDAVDGEIYGRWNYCLEWDEDCQCSSVMLHMILTDLLH